MAKPTTWLLLLLSCLLVACGRSEVATPIVKIVTVVVTTTPAVTPTPLIVTEVQTVVVTTTPEVPPTTTARPVPTSEPPRPLPSPASPTVETVAPGETETPVVRVFKYPFPVLLAPVDTEAFKANGANPLLRWQSVGNLAQDEYYEITIERLWQNKPYYAGSDWTKETEYIVPKAIVLNTSDIDTYTWWVTVKRLTGTNSNGNKIGEAVSPPSESRTFTWK